MPNTSAVRASDAGPVWIDGFGRRDGHKTSGVVAVTFPAEGLIVEYTQPAPFRGNARTHYQAMAQGLRASNVVPLEGRTALVIRQDIGKQHNFGSVSFRLNRSEVIVLGHRSEKTLEGLALSIFNQAAAA